MPRAYSMVNRRTKTSATHRRILEAAEDLVLDLGSEGVTLKAVSARSGVALATLYTQFDSRAALLSSAHRSLAAEIHAFSAALEASVKHDGTPTERLRGLLVATFEALQASGKRLGRLPTILGVPEIEEARSREVRRRRGLITEILDAAAASQELAMPLAEAEALAALATEPAVWSDLLTSGSLERDAAVDLLDGFLTVNLFRARANAGPAAARRAATLTPPSRRALLPASDNSTRDDLIRAVLHVLSTDGPEGVAVAAVADRADVALRTVYNHFGSRGELLEAALDELITQIESALSVTTDAQADPYTHMREFVRVAFAEFDRLGLLLTRVLSIRGMPELDHRLAQLNTWRQEKIESLLVRLETAGTPRLDHREARLLAGALIGHGSWEVLVPTMELPSAHASSLLADALLRTLVAAPAAS